MAQLMALAKAARSLGIERKDIQQLIQRGDLIAFDGNVDYEQLCHCFPRLRLQQDDSATERAKLIRASAFGKRVSQTLVPETDELELRLRKRETELSIAKAQAKRYQKVLNDLLDHLGSYQRNGNAEQRILIQELNRWLCKRLG